MNDSQGRTPRDVVKAHAKSRFVSASSAVVVSAVLFTVGGCEVFSFLPFVDDPNKAAEEGAPKPLQAIDAEAVLQRRWQTGVGRGLGRKYLRIKPTILAERIYAADGYGMVVAIDRFSGRRIWSTSVGTPDRRPFLKVWDRRDPSFLTGGVGAGEGRILVGTTRGEVVALNAGDGSEAWRTQLTSEILSPPAADEGVVMAQTNDGRLVALEPADGATRWSYDNQVPLLTLRGTATPVITGGFVFAGFGDGRVAALSTESGAPIWQHRLMLPQGRTELERLVDVDGAPLVVPERGALFAISYQGRLKALSPPDGRLLWEMPASSHLDLAQGYGQLYFVSDEDVVTAVQQTSAEVVWRQEGLKNRKLTSPLAFSNYVLVGDAEGYLHVLAQSDGRFVARRRLSAGLRSPMIESDGIVYVLANDGKLSAFEIRLGA
ncbi:MAG: outer membrane protein assembly factor BamB [Gammaproteobacteria bacterium]|nr:outer membrane protein assembly factor BamB [Gammaproteobacteria bacterium]MXY55960.1 outer membrane protein assembly factor BamB [Gammaproteobacteria bacterium]MYF28980.1 outer membrane protein assembly factor BamB [Gammaproteobacteria bacterium]MYK45944.1 outer membrane protein assembly factor BamB [Gammaproteobacteria bacterium]